MIAATPSPSTDRAQLQRDLVASFRLAFQKHERLQAARAALDAHVQDAARAGLRPHESAAVRDAEQLVSGAATAFSLALQELGLTFRETVPLVLRQLLDEQRWTDAEGQRWWVTVQPVRAAQSPALQLPAGSFLDADTAGTVAVEHGPA